MNTRQVKFRAWDKTAKEMDYRLAMWSLEELTCMSERYEIMQFTGLLDKNGKEIYESDIVKRYESRGVPELGNDTIEIIEQVEFLNAAFEPVNYIPSEEFEIIGNIYEHSNLLANQN